MALEGTVITMEEAITAASAVADSYAKTSATEANEQVMVTVMEQGQFLFFTSHYILLFVYTVIQHTWNSTTSINITHECIT